jgi:hypothetical protein
VVHKGYALFAAILGCSPVYFSYFQMYVFAGACLYKTNIKCKGIYRSQAVINYEGNAATTGCISLEFFFQTLGSLHLGF